MLQYDSILGWRKASKHLNEPCFAFVKYDGSNLRWEWSIKQGWHKFGTRTQLFDPQTPIYGPSVDLFQSTLGPSIVERIRNEFGRKVERITAFTEFFGPSSFAGMHQAEEPKELRLFDVSVYKKGFMAPADFHRVFNDSPGCAETVYTGPFSHDFINEVREGKLNLNEGVVCKGGSGHQIWMAKVKTMAYMDKLHKYYPHLWEEDKDQQ